MVAGLRLESDLERPKNNMGLTNEWWGSKQGIQRHETTTIPAGQWFIWHSTFLGMSEQWTVAKGKRWGIIRRGRGHLYRQLEQWPAAWIGGVSLGQWGGGCQLVPGGRQGMQWIASKSKAYRLKWGTKKEKLSLDKAYMTAETRKMNFEGAPWVDVAEASLTKRIAGSREMLEISQ